MLPTGGYTGYFQLRCCVGARATRLSDVHEDEVMIVATRSSMPGAPWRSHGTAFYQFNTTLVVITVPVEAQL